ncbi:flagella accessory C family protein [Halobacteria archaeon AArc-curdl1]|uniref:Flagella accessory C family protein n=1 Tax=Natronosalvus hydrolyticus TaxID=2979988 RepID=A0AAP3E5N5_9EURY|nr:flagella accessory C family protein [Halobacteria archaeon AArc-curdl1]
MNLGLGNLRDALERFLGNTGGRRGREREQQRRADGDDGDEPAEEAVEEEPEPETEERPDSDELDDEEVIDDLYHRIDSLEENLNQKDAQLGSIEDSTQHVSSQVEEVNDTIRQLLGIYDRLTDDVNPFTGAGEEKHGFGVFDEDEEPEGFGLGQPASSSEEPSNPFETEAEEDTVSFDDLKHMIEDAAAASGMAAEEPSGGQTITFDEDDVEDTHVEVQATESVDEPEADDSADEDDLEEDDTEEESATLAHLSSTYASDIVVFEWLTELVRTGGPAATLRAISYYHEIGWISEDVKAHLESVLSGPDLDMHVEPESTPDELTAEDHADSYTYIMKLQEIHETKQEVAP